MTSSALGLFVWLLSIDRGFAHDLDIASCRAACLDEFDRFADSDTSCRGIPDCLMCWESCALLHNNFEIWGTMCDVDSLCLSGCKRACSFHGEKREHAVGHTDWLPSSVIHSIYEPEIDCIRLEWSAPVVRQQDTVTAVVYSVFLRNRLVQNDVRWEQVAQTVSQNVSVKRGLLNPATDIKVVALTSRGILAEKTTTFLDDPLHTAADEVIDRKATKVAPADESSWKPQLISLQNSQRSAGVEATVTWPTRWSERFIKYEVSWKVIDDTMEITGHLYTPNTIAVLTLWPDALYSVRIRCYAQHGEEQSVSESLLIDTHGVGAVGAAFSTKCPECFPVEIVAGCAAGVSFFTLVLFATCLCLRYKRLEKKVILQESPVIHQILSSPQDQVPSLANSTGRNQHDVNIKETGVKITGWPNTNFNHPQDPINSLGCSFFSFDLPYSIKTSSTTTAVCQV